MGDGSGDGGVRKGVDWSAFVMKLSLVYLIWRRFVCEVGQSVEGWTVGGRADGRSGTRTGGRADGGRAED